MLRPASFSLVACGKQESAVALLPGNDWKRGGMVAHLRIPSIGEEEEVGTVKEDVEC